MGSEAAPCIYRCWPGATIFCLASGPSLTAIDVAAIRGRGPVIAINDAIRLAPFADVLYSSDRGWWKRASRHQDFLGRRISVEQTAGEGRRKFPDDIEVLRNTGPDGLERDPGGLRTYKNSGGAAINLAVHFGASRIVLLGYDLSRDEAGRQHFHDDPAISSPYPVFRERIATMVQPLADLGVAVVNCSRRTALTCFPCVSLETVLA